MSVTPMNATWPAGLSHGRAGVLLVRVIVMSGWFGCLAPAAQPPAPTQAPLAQPPSPAGAPDGPDATGTIDRQPYRIELHLAFDPSSRMDQARRAILLRQWQALVHRFVGPPWMVSIASKPDPLAGGDLEALDVSAFARFDTSFDKIWLIRVSAGEPASGLVFAGREYDTATRKLGPLQEHRSTTLAEAPRAMLQFALELFSPTALITGQEGGRALLMVRGAALAPASELGRVVTKGAVFVPLRLVTMRDQSVVIRRILFTYLQVEAVEGAVARCAIVSALRDPLTQRVSRPNTLAALGIKPGNSTLRLRFVTRPDSAPAAGYTLISRTLPDGVPHELGMTDRGGRIALKPGFADQLVILRLLAGNAEPMVEFPIMPGESSDLREIPIDPKAMTVTYQVQLDALRDEVIDLVAQRARLEKRMEARLQGEDLAALELSLKEYALLPRKDVYAKRLTDLKDQAGKEQTQSKTAVLTKNIQARFTELQALIDRYLDDEAFTAYGEALDRKRAERGEAAKAAKAKSARTAPPSSPAAQQAGGDQQPSRVSPRAGTPGRAAVPPGKADRPADAKPPAEPF
jgi:hypothetical protein